MRLLDKILYKFFGGYISYSQTGEDKILEHLFNCYNIKNGGYLDIGANEPKKNNNTYLFYKNGWRGCLVEPNSLICEKLKKSRKKDLILNIGISENNDEIADFYIFDSHTLSTFSKEEALQIQKEGVYNFNQITKVQLKPLNSILENLNFKVDFISVDVEGWNYEILKNFDFNKFRPFCFCVETLTFSNNNTGSKISSIFDLFKENGYSVYAETHLNTIFIDSKI